MNGFVVGCIFFAGVFAGIFLAAIVAANKKGDE